MSSWWHGEFVENKTKRKSELTSSTIVGDLQKNFRSERSIEYETEWKSTFCERNGERDNRTQGTCQGGLLCYTVALSTQ